jgi:hypothetical protein
MKKNLHPLSFLSEASDGITQQPLVNSKKKISSGIKLTLVTLLMFLAGINAMAKFERTILLKSNVKSITSRIVENSSKNALLLFWNNDNVEDIYVKRISSPVNEVNNNLVSTEELTFNSSLINRYTTESSKNVTFATILSGASLPGLGSLPPPLPTGCVSYGSGFTNSGTLVVDINGTTTACTDYDQYNVTGNTVLGGTLEANINYSPTDGDQVTFITTTGTLSGTFDVLNISPNPSNWSVLYNTPSAGDVSLRYSDLGVTTSQTNVVCNGAATGAAAVTVTGGTTPYTYSWSPGGATTSSRTGLTAGSYTVTITDAGAISTTKTFTITQPDVFTLASFSQTNIACNGFSTGTATISITGGATPYTYNWTATGKPSPTGNGTNTVTNLPPANWKCTVTQGGGCSGSKIKFYNITQPSVITNTVTSQTNINCYGGSTGAAQVNAYGGTGSLTFDWTPGNPTGDGTNTVSGLSSNIYTCSVTDANSCVVTSTANITQASQIIVSGTVTNIGCNGGTNGSITASATGGTGAYTYSWSGGGSSATNSGLTAGTYTCTVTDANSCSGSQTFTIIEPAVISLAPNGTTNVSCFGGTNGTATVSASGGTSPYSYSWSPSGGTDATGTGLSAGTYTVSVTDVNSCTPATQTFTITQPGSALTVSNSSQVNVSCNGLSDGSASVTVSGGTTSYTYSWTSGGTAATESGLGAGNYTCNITDANGCTTSQTFTISQPDALTVSSFDQTNVSCFGGSNGSASVTVSGGTTSYTYSWSGGGTADTKSGLTAGNYTCNITDANGCTTSHSFTISEPTVLSASSAGQTNVSCFGLSDGSATVSVSGGTTNYTYSWTSGGSSATESGLGAGSYTCNITDANGCTTSQAFTISQPASALMVSNSSQVNVSCNGLSDGSASVTVSGGTTSYTYSWTSGGTAATESGLGAGNYTCNITDANGCTTSQTFTISQPDALTVSSFDQTNVSCFGGSNGSASVTVSGGTTSYTYSWSGGGTADTKSGLTAGNYTCNITDANGCTTSHSFTISEPTVLSASSAGQTNVSCFGLSDGSATVSVSGGTTNYTYSWTSGGSSATESGLGAGSYTCNITDANGCTTSQAFTISQPASALMVSNSSQVNVSCNGLSDGSASVTVSGGTTNYTYSWTSGGTSATESGLAAGNYTCNISDANGCTTSQTFTISEPLVLTAGSAGFTDVSCFGGSNGDAEVSATGGTSPYTYFWLPMETSGVSVSDLIAGGYTCVVTDANGCTTSQTFTISQPTALVVTPTSQTDLLCNGASTGAASVSVSGGTGSYTYSWSPSGGSLASASNLTAGNYSCNITDANGCIASQSFTITQPSALSVAPSQTNILCNGQSNGTATVSVSGGTGSYTYSWSPGGATTTSISSLALGGYTCTITDANGCSTSQTFTITQPDVLATTIGSLTNVACFGNSTGSATIGVTGGTTAYSYNWTPGNPDGDGTATIENLPQATYTCTVTDANSCSATRTFNVTQPTIISIISLSQTNVTCTGGNNGAATVSATGGTGSLTFDWTPGNPSGDGTEAVTGLSAQVYTCTVTDANSCSKTFTFNITVPNPLVLTPTTNNISCNGLSDGSASVAVSGGASPYTYSWSPGGATTTSISSLATGGYTLTVTDANSCSQSQAYTITQPAVLSASADGQTAVSCNGGSNGTATVSVTGGTEPYTYSWSPSGGSAITGTGLSAGNYTCNITDANGCTTSQPFTITEPTAIGVSSSQIDLTCNGGSTGSASVTATGGAGSYSYSWSPSGGSAATASSLSAGSYMVTITDANSCTQTQSFTITQPDAIVVSSVSQTNVSCNGNSTGAATVSASGGTGAYTYSWTSGGTSATETNLAAGPYTCTVTDANGCTGTLSFTITQPTLLSATSSFTNVTCNGLSNGTASVTATGGSGSYTYNWSPAGGTNSSASGLAATNYTCSITDANGCTSSQTFTISEPAALVASLGPQTNLLCYGASNGSATVSVAGGTTPYTYSWSPSGGTDATESGLSQGAYVCTVTDANSCTSSQTFNITQPTEITVSNDGTNDVTCYGGSNGDATILATGGVGTITFSWSPSGGTDQIATGLSAGTYTCTATDANGCSKTQTFTIAQPDELIAASAGQTGVSCNGGSNGTATVSATGGTGAYTYSWSNGSTSSTATDLSATNYTATVTDANGCSSTYTFTITEPSLLVAASAGQTGVSCNGGNNGTATVSAAGGTGAYTYSWSNGSTSATATGLSATGYTATVTDANGCTSSQTFTISEPAALVASLGPQTNLLCYGASNGSATVSVAGGTTPYTYSWSPSGGTDATESGLSQGAYVCTVTDANSCTSSQTFNITQPTEITVSNDGTNDVTCYGGSNGDATILATGGVGTITFSWSPSGGTDQIATGLSAGTYTCTATDANGCSKTQTFTITQPDQIVLNPTVTNISCNGLTNGSVSLSVTGGSSPYTYSWSPGGSTATGISGLAVGSYSVTVTDAGSCSSSQTFAISEPATLVASIGSQTDILCHGYSTGAATVSVAGGTEPYTYNWSPSGATTQSITDVLAASYTCTVTDANSCSATRTFNITQPSLIVVTSDYQTNITCNSGNNGAAKVSVTGGTGSLTFDWSPGTPTGDGTDEITGLSSGTYVCTVTDDNSCYGSYTFTITQPNVIAISAAPLTNVSCNGASDGSITTSVTGGTGAYTYSWSPGGATTASISGLAPNTYSVEVTDANGCSSTTTFTISEPTLLVSASAGQVNVSCNGGSNGTATVSATGGTGAYTYSWSSGSTSATATDLSATTYSATVTDANGCSSTTTFTISEPTLLVSASAGQVNVSCNGGSNGTATVSATGGTGAYTYSWSSGSTSATATDLSATTYSATVTDANGCSSTTTFTISEPTLLVSASAGQVNVSCNGGSNGTATVSATGGTGAYTYSWSSGSTSATATDLSATTYSATVTDANGCSSTTTFTISEPTLLVAASAGQTNVSCYLGSNGTATVSATGGTGAYTYSWSNGGSTDMATGLSAATYTATVTDANGCSTSQTFVITEPAVLEIASSNSTNVTCNGYSNGTATVSVTGGTTSYTYSWSPAGGSGSSASDLAPNTYTCYVTDANGCSTSQTFVITEPAVLEIASSNSTNVTCNGYSNGTATVSVTGGTTSYTYSWSPAGGSGSSASDLAPNTYTCYVTDANGCSTSQTFVITEPAVLEIASSNSTNVTCNGYSNGTATVSVTGGTTSYTYSWSPAGGSGSSASDLAPNTYTCYVTDANGCSTSQTFVITEPAVLEIASSNSTNVTCNGYSNGTATVSVTGGTTSYTYSWSPAGGSGSSASDLAPNTYTCYVTDANGCSTSQTFVITEPAVLEIASSNSTNVTCNGYSNGTATVSVTGGTTSYTYSWSPAGGSGSSASDLAPNTYTCYVTDANGCSTSQTFVITEPAVLEIASSNSTNVTCNGYSNGTATVSVTGGTTSYTYSWSPAGGSGSSASDLAPNTYTCYVTDANGCSTSQTFVITEPAVLEIASSNSTNVTCNGYSNGTATVSVTGGTTSYTYSWSPAGGSGSSASDLAPNTYTCYVTDANGCSTSQTFVITEPAVLEIASSNSTNVTCNGYSNGTATVSVTGGTTSYTYSWSPAGGSGSSASDLAPNTYTCYVTDANGCSTSQTFVITEPAVLEIASSNSTNVTCNGYSNGTATVSVTGGTTSYTYSWSPAGGSGSSASDLAPNTYTCYVTDANGCSTSQTFVITEPAVLEIASSNSTNVTCNGYSNGTATVSVTGGTTSYTYSWSPAGGSGSSASDLAPNTYTCYVTDANGCSTSQTFVITEPAVLEIASSNSTNVTCNGYSNGTATVSVTGGTTSYTYSWSPAGGSGSSASDLAPNTYTCYVTDANGCSTSQTFVITEPAVLEIASSNSTNVTCNGYSNGTATVSVTGGTTSYTYSWSPAGGSGSSASDLAPNTYTCYVTDANGCSTSQTFVITEPAVLEIASSNSTNVTCNGYSNGTATVSVTGGTTSYTYSWSPAGGSGSSASDLAPNTYTCYVTDANGCSTSQTFVITEPAVLEIASSNSTNVTCNGYSNGTATVSVTGGTTSYTYSWSPAGGSGSSASDLAPNTYTCYVTDANGCSTSQTFVITEPTLLVASSAGQTSVSCNGGSNGTATVSATGGTGAYTYSWSSGSTSATATDLSATTYSVTVTDANGCSSTTTFTISEPTLLVSASAGQVNVSCNGGSNGTATVSATGGTGAYTYSWSNGGSSDMATGLSAATYTATVTDANGCSSTTTFTISEPAVLSASIIGNNISCYGLSDGSATVSVTGGTTDYTYSWSPSGGSSATASNLVTGNYTCYVTDANGCSTSQTVSISEPTMLVVTTGGQNDVTTFGGSDGSATVSVSGGTTNYTYSWSPSGGSSATASGLTAGGYTCTVTDANGCSGTQTFTLTQPLVLTVNTSQTNVLCNGGTTGSASVTVSGGSLPYTYSWSPTGGTAATATGLSAGSYTCSITDAGSLSATRTFNITQPDPISVSVASQNNVSCNGGSNGTAEVTAFGGTGSLTFDWTGSPTGDGTESVSDLTAGSYTCTVTDDNGCESSQSFIIEEPTLLVAGSAGQTNVSCHGLSDGSASVSATGGTGAYTYSWSNGGSSSSQTGLSTGTYIVFVMDANGCYSTTSFTITAPDMLLASSAGQVNVSCNGLSDGSASISVSGGTPSYTYNWSSGSSTDSETGLGAGTYTVTVTDANGCSSTHNVTISEPDVLVATSGGQTDVSCFGLSDGTATVSVTGGTTNYTYSWVGTSSTTDIASGLSFGTYTCNITDANGCSTSQSFTITQPDVLAVTSVGQTNVSCFGHSDGTATVSATGGTTDYTYSWSPTGGTGSTGTGLYAGSYTVTVTDANSCSAMQTFTITQPPFAEEIHVTGNSVTVLDGDNTPSLTDHTDFDSITTLTKTRTFTINNSGVANLTVNSITLSGTHASLYAIGGITLPTTIAASGSTTFTVTFSPASPGAKVATVTIANSDCDEGSYEFALNGNISCTSGASAGYFEKGQQYTGSEGSILFLNYGARADTLKATSFGGVITWSPSTYLNCSTCPKPVFTPTGASLGNHTFTVTNGCVSKTISLCVKDARNAAGDSLYICHKDNISATPVTLKFATSAVRQIQAHLSGTTAAPHAYDKIGRCNDLTCTFAKSENTIQAYDLLVDEEDLEVMCSPNPFSHSFKLHYSSSSDKDATIMIYGMTGNLVEKVTLSSLQNDVQLGENLPNGIYTISFNQGNKTRVFKMIKVNR